MVAPISWQPSQHWDGNVGLWSSFALRVGNPEQTVRILPSTAGQATFVVSPAGCSTSESATKRAITETCSDSRGGLFNETQSSSWNGLGNFSLGIEANFGYDILNGTYAQDTVSLGYGGDIGGPTLESQVVVSYAPELYYMGIFGLNHQATNLSNFDNPYASYLTSLKQRDLIPSLSWAYNAGAHYKSTGVFGSLTLGGYDASIYEPNNLSFTLAEDITRDLVVGLQSITATLGNGTQQSLLSSPVLIFIDSTQAMLYLPNSTCQAFEEAFGLTWNETDQVYWVDDELHKELTSMNPKISFTLSTNLTDDANVDIVLPYSSFDLPVATPPTESISRIFPLRRTLDETQYTLGRTFLQEAYLITNYENSSFSISQARNEGSQKSNIIPIVQAASTTILPSLVPTSSQSSTLVTPSSTAIPTSSPAGSSNPMRTNRALIIGVSVIATLMFISILLMSAMCLRRRFLKPRETKDQVPPESSATSVIRAPLPHSPREIGENSMIGVVRELPNSGIVELQTPSEQLVHPALRSTTATIFEISRPPSAYMNNNFDEGNVISASAYQSIFDMSPATLSPVTKTHSWRGSDLNRSLPPTPISESPMPSPQSSDPAESPIPSSDGSNPAESPTLYRWLEEFLSDRFISSQFLRNLGLVDHRLSDFTQPETGTDSAKLPSSIRTSAISEEQKATVSWI